LVYTCCVNDVVYNKTVIVWIIWPKTCLEDDVLLQRTFRPKVCCSLV